MSLSPSMLVNPVAWLLVTIRDFLAPLAGADSGLTWFLAVLVLALLVRALLLPLNIKQFHAQRKMTKIQPHLQEISQKYQKQLKDARKAVGDPKAKQVQMAEIQQAMLKEMNAKKREHGFSFKSLFIPVVVQAVIGIALYHLITEFRPGAPAQFGLSAAEVASGANATLWGAPFAGSLTATSQAIMALGGDPSTTRIVAGVLVVLTALVSALTMRHALQRTPPATNSVSNAAPGSLAAEMAATMMQVQTIMRSYGPFILGGVLLIGYSHLPLGFLVSVLVAVTWVFFYQIVMYKRHPLTASTTGEVIAEVTDQVASEQPTVRKQPKRQTRSQRTKH